MKNNFKTAKQSLRQQGITTDIIAVNGCMYGKDATPLKNQKRGAGEEEPDKVYYRYAGQDF